MTDIKEVLMNFIKDDSLKVAVMKGEWGVGKTYYWKHFLKDNRSKINKKVYSYVSLFGIKDSIDLKKKIFSNSEILDKDYGFDLDKLKPFKKILSSYSNTINTISDLIEESYIDNFLICFDDLERKENTLTTSSILGLISNLKENKNCKVLIIYNESELDEDSIKDFGEYREKVVDIEIKYCPTINNNLSIIWAEECPSYVSDIFKTLQHNNIRVMQRVNWTIKYFEDELNTNYKHFSTSFLTRATILTILYHSYSKIFSLDDLNRISYHSLSQSKEPKDQEKYSIIQSLDYYPAEYDQIIFIFLKNGFVDFEPFRHLLEKKNQDCEHGDKNNEFIQIMNLYYNNFSTQQSEFIDKLSKCINNNYQYISLPNLAFAVKFLKELDDSIDLNHILEEAIQYFVKNNDEMRSIDYHLDQLDPKLSERVRQLFKNKDHSFTISELMHKLVGTNSFNPSDVRYLSKFSEDEIYEWLKSENDLDVIHLVKEFMRRFGVSEESKDVIDKIRKALEKLKKRSQIDQYRVENILK